MAPLTVGQLISNRLAYRLSNLQNLEAFNHRGLLTTASSPWVYQFPYSNWSSTYTALYYKNGVSVTPDSTDLTNGKATFNTINAGDNIDATYQFSYFSLAQMTAFYLLAMSILNNQPPASVFTLDDPVQGSSASYPPDFEGFLTSYAYKCCLETVLMDLMTWRARLIFTDPQLVSSTLQGFLASANQSIAAALPLLKGRRFITFRSTSAGRWSVPPVVGDFNFSQFSILGSSGH